MWGPNVRAPGRKSTTTPWADLMDWPGNLTTQIV